MNENLCTNVILLIFVTVVRCEFFSSVHEVTKLVDYERILLNKMEKFVTLNENKLDYLKEKLAIIEREREEAAEEGDKYFENPINKYLLTKRLTLDWEKLENFLDHEVGTNTLKSIDKFRNNSTFPGEDDFNGAVEGLLRLQQVYRLKTKDIAQGILAGVKYTTELSSKDCYVLGKFAMKENNLLAAHAWLSEALEKFDSYKPSPIEGIFQKPDVLEPLAEVKFKLNDFVGAAEYSYALNLWRPNDMRLMESYNYYAKHAYAMPSQKVATEHEPIPLNFDYIDEFASYRFTCSGHIHPLPYQENHLRCRYLSSTHPFLRIAPLKVEELHLDPLLLIYHDVIYESEIEKLIALANNKMERATVVSNDNGSTVSSVRTSQFVFFPSDTDKVLQTIDERVSDMTGLNMDSAEQHQIANYGIGGHYAQHHDFFYNGDSKSDTMGNRIATVLFYLSDVEQGGGTAFPYVKRLLKPKKGAAAFWYNLHASGDGDSWTKHGACPVLVGSKWVLNRWIREHGQEFKRPCELFRDVDNSSILF